MPGAIQERVSDLDVLKAVFDDPDYDKEELDTLVYSVDIRVDASTLFEVMGVSSAYVSILHGGGPKRDELWTFGLDSGQWTRIEPALETPDSKPPACRSTIRSPL